MPRLQLSSYQAHTVLIAQVLTPEVETLHGQVKIGTVEKV